MRSLHVSRYVHIQSTGGTERYLLDMVRAMKRLGHDASIAWLCSGQSGQTPLLDRYGISIEPFAVPAGYVDLPPAALREQFLKWLRTHPVDTIHFHTFSLSEAMLAEAACSEGVPYLFTYHSPAWSCRRGDLLRWGTDICDGEIRSWRCSACLIQQRLRCPAPAAWSLAGTLAPMGVLGRHTGGKLHRRTAFVGDTARFRDSFKTFLEHAARTVACSEWGIPVLERNGAPPERIVHCPQGVPIDFAKIASEITGCSSHESASFTVGYVGRVTPVKGVHILVEAFAGTVYRSARLCIYGCGDSQSEALYLQHLMRLSNNDPRINFFPRLPLEAMLEEYRSLNLLAIPSTWRETGPFTLFEALALGVDVWGSEMIGQMHLLQEHGRVVRPNTVVAWQDALESAFAKHDAGASCARCPTGIVVRTMQDVVDEMVDVYNEVGGHP